MLFKLCVLHSTVYISDEVNSRLVAAAQALFCAHARRIDLEPSETCAGRVTTEWRRGTLGTLAGPIFEATVEVGSKTGKAMFVIPDRFLEADLDPDSFVVLRS